MGCCRARHLAVLWVGILLCSCGTPPPGPADAGAPRPDVGVAAERDAGPAPGPDAGCVPETDEALCARWGRDCGAASGTDSCGTARSVVTCGSCASTLVCGGSGAVGVCGCSPFEPAIGPVDGFTDIGNLRFNLLPSQVGSKSFEFPNADRNTLRISAVGATRMETPLGTFAQIAVSACPGEFDVPAACQMMSSPGGATFSVGDGTDCPLAPGTYFLNVRFGQLEDPNQTSCINPPLGYCTNWIRIG